jgi:sugar-phosphatase
LLFDLDGVLVDSTDCIHNTWRQWAVRHDMDSEAVHDRIHGRRAHETLRDLAPDLDADAELRALLAHESTATDGLYSVEGAATLLESLAGARWAVVTSGPRAVATHRLRHVGLDAPRVMVCAEDVRQGKPNPEGYLRAATLLGVAPNECVVVEDAPAGVAAARAAGMRVIALATTHDPESLGDAEIVLDRLSELHLHALTDGSIEISAVVSGR